MGLFSCLVTAYRSFIFFAESFFYFLFYVGKGTHMIISKINQSVAGTFFKLYKSIYLSKMKIAEIISFLESLANPSLQESYDNAGLITGQSNWDCTGIVVSLDA